MLISVKTRVLGLITFDVGEICPLEKVKESLSKDGALYSVGFLKRNPQYFDREYCKPLLRLKEFSDTQITSSPEKPSHNNELEIKSGSTILDKCPFREELYLSSSGIGCLFFMTEISIPLNTGQILETANYLVKYNSRLSLRNNASFNIDERLSVYKSRLAPFVIEPRTDYVRRYSVIHIIELDQQSIQFADSANKTLYEQYEREFHALGVRTIEQWEARYPEGVHYKEGNASLSPAGVLKMNMRNTVIYEYPYDEVEIEDLYYPAMVELRIRDMLATAQLQYVQRTLSRYEEEDYREVSIQLIEKLQRQTIKTFNEFDGFYLSTSKRVRNLYLHAYNIFHINNILEVLETKTRYLDNVLLRIQNLSAQRKQQEVITYQCDLLAQTKEASDRGAATKFVLDVIGVLAGLSLSLTIVQTFNLGQIWAYRTMGIFAVAYTVLFLWGKLRTHRVSFRARRSVHVELDMDKEAAVRNLLQSSSSKRVKDISVDQDKVTWLFETSSFRVQSSSRVEVAFHLAGISEKFNALISIESDVRSRWRWLEPDKLLASTDNVLREIVEMLALRTDIVITEAKPLRVNYFER